MPRTPKSNAVCPAVPTARFSGETIEEFECRVEICREKIRLYHKAYREAQPSKAKGLPKGKLPDPAAVCPKVPKKALPGETPEEFQLRVKIAVAKRKAYYAFYHQNVSKKQPGYSEKQVQSTRRFRARHPERARQQRREDYHRNSAKRIATLNLWVQANRDWVNARDAARKQYRRHSDPLYRAVKLLRGRLGNALRSAGAKADNRTFDFLGCSVPEFLSYIETRMGPGMSWENYGRWVFDHVVPLSRFNLLCPLERALAGHFTNIQPLWNVDNLEKKNKLGWKPPKRDGEPPHNRVRANLVCFRFPQLLTKVPS